MVSAAFFGVPPTQKRADVLHQLLHRRTPVITGHFPVEILPYPLDLVVVRAVGWQRVTPAPSTVGGQCHLGDPTVMDAEVIQDHMNHLRPEICPTQLLQQGDKQVTAFARPLHPYQFPRRRVHGSGQVAFDVLSRRQDLLLLSAHHPVQTDLGIQVNIHFVLVDRYVTLRQGREQLPEEANPLVFPAFRPGATHDRTRTPTTRPDHLQCPTQGRDVYTHPRTPLHRADQHLPRPRRTPPPKLLGIAADHLPPAGQVPLVQLPLPVVLPMIQQTQFPLLTEPLGHPIQGGLAHPQPPRRLRGRPRPPDTRGSCPSPPPSPSPWANDPPADSQSPDSASSTGRPDTVAPVRPTAPCPPTAVWG